MSVQTIGTSNEYEILRLQKDVGTEIIMNVKGILRDQGINFTQDLSNSFSLVMMNGKASVESNSPYAHFVDRGMLGGHIVNIDALRDWVRIKVGIDDEKELESVTWAIAHKIQKEGIKPTRFAKKALKKLIGEHGMASIRRTSRRNKGSKTLGKIVKVVKKINKTLSKISKNINKVYKPIRRYK